MIPNPSWNDDESECFGNIYWKVKVVIMKAGNDSLVSPRFQLMKVVVLNIDWKVKVVIMKAGKNSEY